MKKIILFVAIVVMLVSCAMPESISGVWANSEYIVKCDENGSLKIYVKNSQELQVAYGTSVPESNKVDLTIFAEPEDYKSTVNYFISGYNLNMNIMGEEEELRYLGEMR
jgi:hypothetical protein